MIPVPLPELLALLDKLHAPVNKAALTQAYARAQAVPPLTDRPQDYVRGLLSDAGMKDIRLALFPWRRFDPRHLPALMWHEQTWWLAERHNEEGRADTLTLTREGVEPRTLAIDDIVTGAPGTTAGDETAVLWFSLASHVQSENLSDSENPAMRLVWRELLRDRRWVFRVAAATLLVNILAIPTSLFAMQVYDRVVPTLAWATLTTLVAGMGLGVGLDWLLKTLRAHIMDSVASSVDKRLSQHVYEHLLHLQLDQQPGSLGTLAAQVGALDSVRQVFSAGLVFGIVDLPFALLFIGIIGLIGGPVGWVYLGMLPIALALGLYTIWLLVTMGNITRPAFIGIAQQGGNIDVLVQALSGVLNSRSLDLLLVVFSNFAVASSFLGVTLGLFDYLADLFGFDDSASGRFKTALLTFLPPIVGGLLWPNGFLYAIGYAGLAATIWAAIVPALLARASRKRFGSPKFRVWGGKPMIALILLFGVGNAIVHILSSFNVLPVYQ